MIGDAPDGRKGVAGPGKLDPVNDAGREVRAIVSAGDVWLGALPAFHVDSPWWAMVEPVTAHLDRLLGVPTAVLRMVSTTGKSPRGGEVTYHVETLGEPIRTTVRWEPVPPAVTAEVARPHRNRMPWAEAGGPRSIVDWAVRQLESLGRPPAGTPVQVKSWNLSCLYRFPTAGGMVWSKSTGSFLVAESVPIGQVAAHDPELVPTVLATTADGRLTLLDEVPGEDCWDADAATVVAVVRRLVAVQAALAGSGLDGLPDHRVSTLGTRAQRLLADDVLATLSDAERTGLARLLDQVPAGAAAIAELGMPDTLVHGDFHPGNWRSDGERHTIVDWSDANLGHPATDLLRLTGWLPEPLARLAVETWVSAWRAAVPGCDPAPAAGLMATIQHLQSAITYQDFLDSIEPGEWPYHLGDPAEEIRQALAANRTAA